MNSKKAIGVMGCLPRLPSDFPLTYPENSGNMVHANAPFRIFKNAFFIKDFDYSALGYSNFADFVNKKCSHLVITLANTLKIGDIDGAKYTRLSKFVSSIDRPVVVFGLGVQSKEQNLSEATLPKEAVGLIEQLSRKSYYLGVRGEYTKKVIEKLCDVKNVYVTGCPSIFSNPSAFKALRENILNPVGRPAYSGTHYHQDYEKKLLINAIKADHWLVEPVNKLNHGFYLRSLIDDVAHADVPYFLKGECKAGDKEALSRLKNYFLTRYRLFRNVEDWYQFNWESVSYTYGSRFHVNMASLVSGKPAVWFTHDARTKELVDFMCLPSLDILSEEAQGSNNILDCVSYEKFFDNLGWLQNNFNEYLRANGLPRVEINF